MGAFSRMIDLAGRGPESDNLTKIVRKLTEAEMDRDAALKLDTLVLNMIGNLDHLAWIMKKDLTDEEFQRYKYNIGRAMGELAEISSDFHERHPDIVPEELRGTRYAKPD
jgi:hypothetical protein